MTSTVFASFREYIDSVYVDFEKLPIEERLSKIIQLGKLSKGYYVDAYQAFLETFISNYDGALSKNSKPLYDFIKTLDSVEKTKIRMWLLKYTSLESLSITDKGAKIKLKEGFNTLQVFEGSPLWVSMKIEVKPFEPSNDKLKESLKRLLKNYTKQNIKDILESIND